MLKQFWLLCFLVIAISSLLKCFHKHNVQQEQEDEQENQRGNVVKVENQEEIGEKQHRTYTKHLSSPHYDRSLLELPSVFVDDGQFWICRDDAIAYLECRNTDLAQATCATSTTITNTTTNADSNQDCLNFESELVVLSSCNQIDSTCLVLTACCSTCETAGILLGQCMANVLQCNSDCGSIPPQTRPPFSAPVFTVQPAVVITPTSLPTTDAPSPTPFTSNPSLTKPNILTTMPTEATTMTPTSSIITLPPSSVASSMAPSNYMTASSNNPSTSNGENNNSKVPLTSSPTSKGTTTPPTISSDRSTSLKLTFSCLIALTIVIVIYG